ncbi:glycoside hydrolase family 18 protein [Moniliophthora roreri]|nr:glycoside hydrolase family 18 protein [Moniliophthora roreri]
MITPLRSHCCSLRESRISSRCQIRSTRRGDITGQARISTGAGRTSFFGNYWWFNRIVTLRVSGVKERNLRRSEGLSLWTSIHRWESYAAVDTKGTMATASVGGWIGCNAIDAQENLALFLQKHRADPISSQLQLYVALSLVACSVASSDLPLIYPVSPMPPHHRHELRQVESMGLRQRPQISVRRLLGCSCKPTESAVRAVDQWAQAGVPLDEIVLGTGVVRYGYCHNRSFQWTIT